MDFTRAHPVLRIQQHEFVQRMVGLRFQVGNQRCDMGFDAMGLCAQHVV